MDSTPVSKAISSFSEQSVHSFKIEEDDDDIANNTEVQRDLQLEIGRLRIIDILNESLNNVWITLCLNTFMEKADVLVDPYFNYKELSIIYKGFLQCNEPSSISNNILEGKNVQVSFHDTKIQSTDTLDTSNETSLKDALDIFCKNPNIIDVARSMITDSRLQNTNEYTIFKTFSKLIEFFTDRLNVRADEERRNSDFLVAVWEKNENSNKKKVELQNTLKEKRSKHEKLINEKTQYISKHEKIINNTNHRCQEQIDQNTRNAERRMADDWHQSVEKQSELKELCKKIRNEMEALVTKHISIEKQSRAKRVKTEMQLLSWIKKYDDEMGQRQDRYDVLLKEFEAEKCVLLEMTKKFEEQEEIYTELMKEKNEYLHQTWLNKVNLFIRNIAARHIQRWYRKILKANAAKRRAAQKGKKGR